jgi:hypothetical protein
MKSELVGRAPEAKKLVRFVRIALNGHNMLCPYNCIALPLMEASRIWMVWTTGVA